MRYKIRVIDSEPLNYKSLFTKLYNEVFNLNQNNVRVLNSDLGINKDEMSIKVTYEDYDSENGSLDITDTISFNAKTTNWKVTIDLNYLYDDAYDDTEEETGTGWNTLIDYLNDDDRLNFNLEDLTKYKVNITDSKVNDNFEALWYDDEERKFDHYETKEFRTRKELMNFYEQHKNDKDKYGWWCTRRDNEDGELLEDIIVDSLDKQSIKDVGRGDVLESTICNYADNFYKKKDIFGLGLSQKDKTELIDSIDKDPVFRRYVEQKVRDWIKENKDSKYLNVK